MSLRQQLGGLRHLRRRVMQLFDDRHQVRVQLAVGQLDVFRDVDQHRARAAATGDGKGFCHDARQRVQ
ncbi:hypothetical protein D3C72_1563110 [compost metagenome]